MSPPGSQDVDRALPWLTWRTLALTVLGALGIVLVWTRFRHLGQSFWHDEAYTVLYFSGEGPEKILTLDAIADSNNHVLYNLLSWATAAAISTTEAVYRAWSVVPGTLALVLAVWWAWRRLNVATALILATLAVAAPLHAEQVGYARGYGLAILAAVGLIILADRLAREPSGKRLLAVLATAAVGIATLYSFALVFLGHVVALLAQPRLRRPLLAGGAVAVLAAIFLFGPVVDELSEARPVSADSIPLLDAVTLRPAFEAAAFIGAPDWIPIVGLLLTAYAAVALARRGETELMLNLLIPPLLLNVVFSIIDAPDETRYQLIVFPHVVLLVSIALADGALALWRVPRLRLATAAAGVAIVVLLCLRLVEREEIGRSLPLEDPRAAAEIVEGTGITTVLSDSPRPQALEYYLGLAGIDLETGAPGEIRREFCDAEGPLVYIRHEPYELDTLPFYARPAATDCLERRGALAIDVPQRHLGRPIRLWILPGPEGLAPAAG